MSIDARSLESRGWWRRALVVVRGLAWVIAAGLMGLAIIDGLATEIVTSGVEHIARTLAAVIALVIIVILLSLPRVERFPPDVPILHQKTEAQLRALLQISEDEAELFARRLNAYNKLILELRGRASHIHERFTIAQSSMARRITKQFVISAHMAKILREATITPFPIAVVRKGHLPDNLRVFMPDGTRLSIAPYEEVLRLQLCLLQVLFEETFGPPAERALIAIRDVVEVDGKQIRHEYPDFGALEMQSYQLVARQGVLKSTDADDEARILKLIESLLRACHGTRSTSSGPMEKLIEFIRRFRDRYPLVVEMNTENAHEVLNITYSHDSRSRALIQGWRDRLRIWSGLSAYRFQVPITQVYLASSYHLVLEGDPSTYLYSQVVRDTESGRRVPVAELSKPSRSETPYIRLRHRTGMSYAHVYARGFQKSEPKPLAIDARFHERPPGALGSATVISSVLAIFVISLGWLMSVKDMQLNSDIPALLLALPGVSAGLLGAEIGSGALRHTSLTTRAGLGATLLLSVAGIVLYLAQAVGELEFEQVRVSALGDLVAVKADPTWLGVCILSVLTGGWMLLQLALRTRSYQNVISSSGAEDTGELPWK